jgi:carbonic anhydrase/acetyltransferase-like protein (isoleucine patch superfamily)
MHDLQCRSLPQVTIGHGAIIHACTIESEVLIGMGAKILDGAVVRKGSIVGAGSVVPPGTEIPSGQVWFGCPAKFARHLEPEEEAFLPSSAENYAELAETHLQENTKVWLVRFCVLFHACGLVL